MGPWGGLVNSATFNQQMGYQPSPLSQSFLPPSPAYPQQPPAIPSILSSYQGTGWAGQKLGGEDDAKAEEKEDEDDDDDVEFLCENKVDQEAGAQESAQDEGAAQEVISELAEFAEKLREAIKDLKDPSRFGPQGIGMDDDLMDI